eukprot:jgi/Picsp_1/4947/NSC_02311-R1_protein
MSPSIVVSNFNVGGVTAKGRDVCRVRMGMYSTLFKNRNKISKSDRGRGFGQETREKGGHRWDSLILPRANLFESLFGKGGDGDDDDKGKENKFEADNFVPLDASGNIGLDGSGEEKTFGPLCILVAGLVQAEFAALQMLLDDLGAEEVRLLPYTSDMASMTLGDALRSSAVPDHEEPFEGSKPVAFLSGMFTSEIVQVVGHMKYCDDLPDMAFAAAVPNNWGRVIEELIEDVHADHLAVAAMRAQQQQDNDTIDEN